MKLSYRQTELLQINMAVDDITETLHILNVEI